MTAPPPHGTPVPSVRSCVLLLPKIGLIQYVSIRHARRARPQITLRHITITKQNKKAKSTEKFTRTLKCGGAPSRPCFRAHGNKTRPVPTTEPVRLAWEEPWRSAEPTGKERYSTTAGLLLRNRKCQRLAYQSFRRTDCSQERTRASNYSFTN